MFETAVHGCPLVRAARRDEPRAPVARGSFRIRAGRSRGVEGSPKTESSNRDVDMLPPVVEALQGHRAQQATARLAAGLGAPEPGRDYVFTMPSGRCVDPNELRRHVWDRTIARAKLRRRTMYRPVIASRRTPWQRASRRRGWPRCSGTRRPKCSSASTHATSRTARGATAARCSRAWARHRQRHRR